MRNVCINIEINFTFVNLSLLLLFLCNLAILYSRLVVCSVLFSYKITDKMRTKLGYCVQSQLTNLSRIKEPSTDSL